MKAIAIHAHGGPERLQLLDLPVPEPKPDELLVRVHAAGVNLVDAMFRDGYLSSGHFPLVMGSDFAGEVVEAGAAVRDFRPGDAVFGYKLMGNGTYAEFATVPAGYAAHQPATLSPAEAAGLPCVGLTAYIALVEVLRVRAGESVLVTAAAGGVGVIAVQVAKALGARVVATASGRNHGFLRDLGAEHVVDYTAGDFADAVRAIFPDGVDAALTCLAGETKRRTPAAVRDGGRMAWISGEEKPGPPMERMVAGAYTGGRPDHAVLTALAELSVAGKLRVPVQRVYPLAEAASAQREMEAGHARGKLVLAVGAEVEPTSRRK